MNQPKTVPQQLKALLTEYQFNPKSLSIYLGITEEQMERFSNGDFMCLPNDDDFRFRLFNKILFLFGSAADDKEQKLVSFLEVLLTYHQLSAETIAKMAGVETEDVQGLLADPPHAVSETAKLKIAVTVMSLRFFLKDYEPNN